MLLTRAESMALVRLVGALAVRFNAQVKLSHVLRALVALLLHAEDELDKRAGEVIGLIRPPNGDAKALQRFEREIARVLRPGRRAVLLELDSSRLPVKALAAVERLVGEAKDAERWGVRFGEPSIDLDRVRKWKDEVVEKLTGGLGTLRKNRGVDYIRGEARFCDASHLTIRTEAGQERSLAFKNAIIATGSEPVRPKGLWLDGKSHLVMDSATALRVEQVPGRPPEVGGDVGRVAVLEQARYEVWEAVQEVRAVNRGVGRQAAVADQAFQPWLPRADEPSVSRTHRMAVAADPVLVHFRPLAQVVDGPPHVEDVLPGHALAGDHVPQELETLEVAAF